MKNKTLDLAAQSVVAVTIGGIALSMGLNWQFTIFFLIPLTLMVVGVGWTIGWAALRCRAMWNDRERIERAKSQLLAKVTMMVAAAMLVIAPAAKALDDDLHGGFMGIYTHLQPTMSIYWGNFIRQFRYAWNVGKDNTSSNWDGR